MKYIIVLMSLLVSSCFSCAGQNLSVKALAKIEHVGTVSGTAFKVVDLFDKPRILTAGHLCQAVLAGHTTVNFEYLDGSKYVAQGGKYGVLRISETSDICELYVIEPSNNHLKHLKLASNWTSMEPISVYGSPLGIGPARSDGYLIGRSVNVFYASVMALPGNSGSPVVNADGEVLGMLVAGYMNISVLVPYQEIEQFLYEK